MCCSSILINLWWICLSEVCHTMEHEPAFGRSNNILNFKWRKIVIYLEIVCVQIFSCLSHCKYTLNNCTCTYMRMLSVMRLWGNAVFIVKAQPTFSQQCLCYQHESQKDLKVEWNCCSSYDVLSHVYFITSADQVMCCN